MLNATKSNDHMIRAELARIGLRWANCVSWNDSSETLLSEAVDRGEGKLSRTGAFTVATGDHTGRSPNDKFIVREAATEDAIWWDNNKSISRGHFETLKTDMMQHARLRSLHVQDLVAGAERSFELPTRVITERAWHGLFIRHLLRQPTAAAFAPRLTIIDLPSFKADPGRHGTASQTVVALDLKNGLVLIGGTEYAGEIKKAVFTVLNYQLPALGVLPMHCSANVGEKGDTAIFFGLSGTGKTTLSTDPQRRLIGDDEHGWSADGVFNFEGGCYAKVAKLSAENEPAIHRAVQLPGSVLENVVLDKNGRPDFDNISLTENTRGAYPLEAVENADATGCAGVPKAIIMLTADAFGVLPPVAVLTPDEAMYHFLSGYTAKVAGTERGITEPKAVFSACFGAPFLPRHPQVYGQMLGELMHKHNVPCYLVNTGWSGGGYGVGKRMPLAVTRALVNAALDGSLAKAEMRTDCHFGFHVPKQVDGVPSHMLDPRQCWANVAEYEKAASHLVALFAANIAKFSTSMTPDVAHAGPAHKMAAE
jgi:phosphoenolpyruvate carboxykinase (ATP)